MRQTWKSRWARLLFFWTHTKKVRITWHTPQHTHTMTNQPTTTGSTTESSWDGRRHIWHHYRERMTNRYPKPQVSNCLTVIQLRDLYTQIRLWDLYAQTKKQQASYWLRPIGKANAEERSPKSKRKLKKPEPRQQWNKSLKDLFHSPLRTTCRWG